MILDTNAISAILGGDPAVASVLESDTVHQIPSIVIGEYFYGLERSRHRRRLKSMIERLARQSEILDVDHDTARVYARVRDQLRRAGTPIPENDVWIASLALQHGQPVVSLDAHFDRVEGVQRRSW